jgi:hypothetical protein
MSVYLSPIGGAASQFFDNDGTVLAGGKIYTYAGGTSTPKVTYTTSAGSVPHANPIVLDSAGRVPGGEIWLQAGSYKFSVFNAASVLIGTYDNITGAFNPANIQVVNGTGNGVLTTFSMPTTPISVLQSNIYINGVYQNKNSYTLAGSVFTFTQAPPLTSVIEFNYY